MRGGEAQAAAGGEVVERQFALSLDQDRADPCALRRIRSGPEQGALIRRVDKQDAARVQAQLDEAGAIRHAAGLELAEPKQGPLRREAPRKQDGKAQRAGAVLSGSRIDFVKSRRRKAGLGQPVPGRARGFRASRVESHVLILFSLMRTRKCYQLAPSIRRRGKGSHTWGSNWRRFTPMRS